MNEKRRFLNAALPVAPALLLTLAHTVAVLALLSFVGRVQDYPIHPVGIAFYTATCALTITGILIGTFRIQRGKTGVTEWVLFSLPAWASLTLYAGMWSTPWFGGAKYAAYDLGELDLIWFFNLIFAIFFAIPAILYSSQLVLGIFSVLHIGLYLATHLVPMLIYYPLHLLWDLLMEIARSPAIGLIVIYGVSALLIALRQRFKPQWPRPGVWAVTTLTGFMGAWRLYRLMRWFPRNGDQLAYVTWDTFVPGNAWNWLRPAAETLALVAAGIALLVGLVYLIRNALSFARTHLVDRQERKAV